MNNCSHESEPSLNYRQTFVNRMVLSHRAVRCKYLQPFFIILHFAFYIEGGRGGTTTHAGGRRETQK